MQETHSGSGPTLVDARALWREASEPPSKGYHYNRNHATCVAVGAALGRAMTKLLKLN